MGCLRVRGTAGVVVLVPLFAAEKDRRRGEMPNV